MDVQSLTDEMICALDLKRHPVGIKFIFSKEEFDRFNAGSLKTPCSYCLMVKIAFGGRSIKADLSHSRCPGASRVLGLTEPDDRIVSGNHFYSFHLYNSLATAKRIHGDITYINHKIHGVALMPLEKWKADPDVVIVVANSYQVMRILQGYAYHFGMPKSFKLCGNQGLCSELTATPYETNDLNISVLCSNTRFTCKWKDEEMGIGIPFHKLGPLVEGILKTLNPTEPDARKKEIVKRAQKGNLRIAVEFGNCYYSKKT
jgi:uncharacterized protein (DUF169 family)